MLQNLSSLFSGKAKALARLIVVSCYRDAAAALITLV
jgi:hypothetical protein